MFKAVIAASGSNYSFQHIWLPAILNFHLFGNRKRELKHILGKGNDALEFFLHFIDRVEQANAGKTELNPANSFKFGIEDRISCSSGKVKYNRRQDYILSLNIPLHEATNKEELKSFHKLKAEKLAEGKDLSGDEIVRPRVPLEACLANFSAHEDIHDFYSTALKRKTTTLK
ncbi:ubiquitin carboxyl-terminal hydrolase 14-like protein [Trifolium pratense]|uniref:Ubiquitin carboxyl-terminal hydrolase 14-like protein n=1 Tax=Trifolium pratense TaxID=57577 RepID=A0A2K3N1X4_TRIPR|nr:ubiquitin carboxyl-terminal hydrolase 14-like protein [Trifolium pratense]